MKLPSISGFGYSFSNAAYNIEKENGKPFIAVGAVNLTESESQDTMAVLLTSALICTGIKQGCKSEGILSTNLLKPFREMNQTNPGNIVIIQWSKLNICGNIYIQINSGTSILIINFF